MDLVGGEGVEPAGRDRYDYQYSTITDGTLFIPSPFLGTVPYRGNIKSVKARAVELGFLYGVVCTTVATGRRLDLIPDFVTPGRASTCVHL